MPHIGMNFDIYLDGLSILFSLLITGIGSLVVLYSIGYLDKSERLGNFYCYLLLFMGAMLGVVLSDNIIILYLFWELTSFSSFLLISFWREKESFYIWSTKITDYHCIWRTQFTWWINLNFTCRTIIKSTLFNPSCISNTRQCFLYTCNGFNYVSSFHKICTSAILHLVT